MRGAKSRLCTPLRPNTSGTPSTLALTSGRLNRWANCMLVSWNFQQKTDKLIPWHLAAKYLSKKILLASISCTIWRRSIHSLTWIWLSYSSAMCCCKTLKSSSPTSHLRSVSRRRQLALTFQSLSSSTWTRTSSSICACPRTRETTLRIRHRLLHPCRTASVKGSTSMECQRSSSYLQLTSIRLTSPIVLSHKTLKCCQRLT